MRNKFQGCIRNGSSYDLQTFERYIQILSKIILQRCPSLMEEEVEAIRFWWNVEKNSTMNAVFLFPFKTYILFL